MTEAVLRTPLCIYMTTETLLRPMLHHLSPNEGRMHFFALLPHQLTKYSNAMAMHHGHDLVMTWITQRLLAPKVTNNGQDTMVDSTWTTPGQCFM